MCIGVPIQIIAIDTSNETAIVELSGSPQTIDLSLIGCVDEQGQSRLHQWVIVNHGFAMTVVDEADARATLKAFEELGKVEEDVQAFVAIGH